MTVTARCPHCDSDQIQAVDTVIQTTVVADWVRTGTGVRPYAYVDNEIHWDTCKPHGTGYQCGDCGKELTLESLVVSEGGG